MTPNPTLGRLLWPVVAVVLFLAWSNIPPYRTHINGVRWGDAGFAWHWRLYEQGGLGVCDVRYFDMNRSGEPVERWTLLGYDEPGDMPDRLARTHEKQLRVEYDRVCDALAAASDRAPKVEVYARCGVRPGWKVIENRGRNVCKTKRGVKR